MRISCFSLFFYHYKLNLFELDCWLDRTLLSEDVTLSRKCDYILIFVITLVVKIVKLIISNSPSVVCTQICIHACMSLLSGKKPCISQNDNFFQFFQKEYEFFSNPYFQHEKSATLELRGFHPTVTMRVCQTLRGVQVLLRHNRRTGKSFLSSSPPARPPVCGPSCASAWRPGSGRSPGRWCTGTETLRCVCAGA